MELGRKRGSMGDGGNKKGNAVIVGRRPVVRDRVSANQTPLLKEFTSQFLYQSIFDSQALSDVVLH